MSYAIAIDGPAGAGKSTISKMVASELSYIYVDTGALYRAIAYAFLKENLDITSEYIIQKKLNDITVSLKYVSGMQQVFLNEKNITGELRTEQVGNMASKVSAIKEVREKLLHIQRDIAEKNNVVMDGRDIGTYVLPKANLKIFLTASVHVRAMRRYKELIEKGERAEIKKIEEDIEIRDSRDSNREISPLKQAQDAILIDCSDLSIEEVVNRIIEMTKR